ncbi:hypothetical protein AD936_13375 [Gluconobacter japonicus]|nr:hypothetical protein AD936_13375 [Gluconobacter japonicus]
MPKNRNEFFLSVIFLSLIIIFRIQTFGNPLIYSDEEFYLFAGGRILHGDLPYIQFWDRKPVGIFLLYAFFHLFGPYRVLAYQFGALIAVWATTWLLFRMGKTIASPKAAFLSALLYPALLNLSRGEGGQTPIFYNFLVTAAIALMLRDLLQPDGKIREKTAFSAIFLFGMAMQIKYTVVFEGAFVGVYYVARHYLTARSIPTALKDTGLLVLVGLLPTLLAFFFYVAIGHSEAWIFANLESIFLRASLPGGETHQLQIRMLKAALPLLPGLVATILLARAKSWPSHYLFLILWAGTACLGIIAFGGWYPHYILPLYAPLALTCVSLWTWKAGRAWLIGLLCIVLIIGQNSLRRHRINDGDQHIFQAMLKVIRQKPGCVFVYQGPPALYDTPYWCALTNHSFPGHFNTAVEAHATGMDVLQELDQVLAKKPEYIVTEDASPLRENLAARHEIFKTIKSDYMSVYHFTSVSNSIYIYRHR